MRTVPCAPPSWRRRGAAPDPMGSSGTIGVHSAGSWTGQSASATRSSSPGARPRICVTWLRRSLQRRARCSSTGSGSRPGSPPSSAAQGETGHRPPRSSRLCLCHPPYPCGTPPLGDVGVAEGGEEGFGGPRREYPLPEGEGGVRPGPDRRVAGPSRASGRAASSTPSPGAMGSSRCPPRGRVLRPARPSR